jgi:hypothetical protein
MEEARVQLIVAEGERVERLVAMMRPEAAELAERVVKSKNGKA